MKKTKLTFAILLLLMPLWAWMPHWAGRFYDKHPLPNSEIDMSVLEKMISSFTEKHRYRVNQSSGWKWEVWLNGSTFSAGDSFDITLRATPLDDTVRTPPQARALLRLRKIEENKSVIRMHDQLQFVNCLNKKPGMETIGFDDDEWGEMTDFPQGILCWEVTFSEPSRQEIDRRNDQFLDEGDYELEVEVELPGVPRVLFRRMGFERIP